MGTLYNLFHFRFLGVGWYSLFIVLMSEKADKEFIGLTVSFGLTLNQIFIVLAPSLFGLSVDYFNGYKLPFSLLILFISIGVYGFTYRKETINIKHKKKLKTTFKIEKTP